MGKIVLFLGPTLAEQEILKVRLMKEEQYNFHAIKKSLYSYRRIPSGFDDYHFLNESQFSELVKQKQIVDKKEEIVKGRYMFYVVNNKDIDLINNNYLEISDLEGLDNYKDYYGENSIVPILVKMNEEERMRVLFDQERKKGNSDYCPMCQNFLGDYSIYSEENIAKRNITDIVEFNVDVEDMVLKTKIILAKRLYK